MNWFNFVNCFDLNQLRNDTSNFSFCWLFIISRLQSSKYVQIEVQEARKRCWDLFRNLIAICWTQLSESRDSSMPFSHLIDKKLNYWNLSIKMVRSSPLDRICWGENKGGRKKKFPPFTYLDWRKIKQGEK